MRSALSLIILVTAGVAAAAPLAKPPTKATASPKVDGQYFLTSVRPVLIGRCLGCHGGDEPQAKLDLSTREAAIKGGFRAVLRPGRSADSILMHRVAGGTMPPKNKLPAAEVAILRRWIDAGAPWSGGKLDLSSITTSTRAGLDWWALQPLGKAVPPAAPTEPAIPPESRAVDAFLRQRLIKSGLDFSPPAPRETYIRRVTYDLHGLPPTRQEIRDFVADTRPDAYERLVDRLLASPRFGERFARRWLDVVRFAESDGYEHDLPRLKAWPYRDWVIAAFNDDMPYDRFVREQIAGDALHPDDPKAGIPTSFLVAGGYDAVGAKQAAENFRLEVRQDELEDMIGTTSQVLLGMTAQCARCHDHKFDPIPQSDYYRLQAAFAGAQHHGPTAKADFYGVRSDAPPTTWLLKRGQVTARGPEMQPGALTAIRGSTAPTPPPYEGGARGGVGTRNSELGTRGVSPGSGGTPHPDPTVPSPPPSKGGPGGVSEPGTRNSELGTRNVRDTKTETAKTNYSAEDRARRLELANWITAPGNPLTSRVMANRVWGWVFGQGIVDTPNDFGFNGDRPSHPELLDYLAVRFSRPPAGQTPWSVKGLVRTLILTRAYRQSSEGSARAEAKDAGNRLLWRFNARRLESEEVRDSLLTAAGTLNLKMGGPGFQLFTWKENAGALYQPIDPEGEEYCRRSIYRMVVRGTEDPLLTSLDCPDASITTPRRQETTTATQALSLLNNSFVDRQSRAFAERVQREAPGGIEAQVRVSYDLSLGREPSAPELARATAFVRQHGLAGWCRVLFNTSEFLYLD